MLNFDDHPYVAFPPKPNRFLIQLIRFFNRYWYLPRLPNKISEVQVQNPELFNSVQADPSARILFLPNHPTRAPAPFFLYTHEKRRPEHVHARWHVPVCNS